MKPYTYLIYILLALTLIIPAVCADIDYYTLPVEVLTNSPLDAQTSYFGNRPSSPTTNLSPVIMAPGYFPVYIPSTGVIERVEIYDYSGTAGTAEGYAYYIVINNATEYLIANLSVATNERRFSNTTINISVTKGDFFEIMRKHPTWATNPATNIAGGYIFINSTTKGYAFPIQATTHSPGDAAVNYMCWRPGAPTVSGQCTMRTPSGGNITGAYIIDNSSATTGTNQVVSYQVPNINGNDTPVMFLSSTNGTRLFRSGSLTPPAPVNNGFDLEVRRVNPTWTTNPLNTIVGGILFIDTTLNTHDVEGYPLYVQAISSGPTDAQTVYFGNRPVAPSTTAAINKIYIPKNGTINRVFITAMSGTAGTNETWSMYVRKNNTQDVLIRTIKSASNERRFLTTTLGLAVTTGDYIEIKGVQPTWATNPATTIYGGYVFVDYGPPITPPGGDIVLPVVSDFSANITSAVAPALLQFFDQSNNTVPGTTAYYWNFTNGGTVVDSASINPTFTYTSSGTKTINHTVVSGGVTSIKTGTVNISGGGTAVSSPNASFTIVLTDTSTQYPTSWKWNVTNLLGNNTEVTTSTAQNLLMNFGTGNWKINLTATNAFGSNTTTQYVGWNLSSPRVYFWNRTA